MSSSLYALARRMVDGSSNLARSVWQAGLSLLGILRPVTAGEFFPRGGQRVVVIAPHPDDEVLSCGGAIKRHIEAGDSVRVVFVTDGRKSGALRKSQEAMAEIRRAEASASAQAWGFEPDWLNFPEGSWDIEALCSILRARFKNDPPDIVYAPSRMDYHAEHIRTADAVSGWLTDLPELTVRIYATQVPLTALLTNIVMDVTDLEQLLLSSSVVYRSQAGNFPRMNRLRQYTAARYRRGTLAESFLELSGERYRDLNETLSQHRNPFFFGLRHWAFTDPFAYLYGSRLRSELKEITCGL